MKTRKRVSQYIYDIATRAAERVVDPAAARSSYSVSTVYSSEASGSGDKSLLANVLAYVSDLIPHHFRGAGGDVVARDPADMSITIQRFEVDGGVVAGGRLHSISSDVTLDLSPYIGQEGRLYCMINGSVPYISRIRNPRHGCLGAVMLKAASRRIIDHDPVARYSALDPQPDASDADGYIVSGRDPAFDDFAVRFDDPYVAAMRNVVGEVLAENVVGVMRLHEGLTIENSAGTLAMDSSAVKFFNSAGDVLAEYGATRAFVGDIELLPTALQSRNFVAGTSGFQIHRDGSAEFQDVTVRGVIQALSGWIGGAAGWAITTGLISGDSGYLGIATTAGNATYALWVSNDTPANANFSVTHAGILTAVGANISGSFSAGTIDIGGSDDSSFHVDADGNMWLGAGLLANATFSVTKQGVVNAKEVNGIRPFIQHYADTWALELELMKMNFQYVSWAQFAIFDAFDDETKRADPDPSTYDARVYESKLDNGGDDTADRAFGFVSKTYDDITDLWTGNSTSVGTNYLQDTDASWFIGECRTLTLIDSLGTTFTIATNTSDTLVVSGTPAAGAYRVRDTGPSYFIGFLSYLDSSNGGSGSIRYEVSFDGGSNYQTIYETGVIDVLEATQSVVNSGYDYKVRITLLNDGTGAGPVVYKYLVCTDPSPWRY